MQRAARTTICPKLTRRSTGRSLEEMTEGKLVAESKGGGDFCDRLVRGCQQRGGCVGSSTLEIARKRLSHGRLEKIGTILLGVTQKLRQ